MSSQIQRFVGQGMVLGLATACSQAQSLHAVDYLIRVSGGVIETGGVGPAGEAVYPVRVKSGVFGAEGVPNFTNDPGVNAELGQLVPGMSVGFDLTHALRRWDSSTGFEVISPDRITVRKSGINTVTPVTDAVVPGIVFGQADLDDAAGFHHHVQFILNPGGGGVPSGLWLLTWELWTDAPGIQRTEPLYIVFAQGSGATQISEAVAWVETNLVGSPCIADLAEPFDVLNFFDVSAFLGLYNGQQPGADLAEPPGVWNFFDVSVFLGAYNAGCP